MWLQPTRELHIIKFEFQTTSHPVQKVLTIYVWRESPIPKLQELKADLNGAQDQGV